MKHSKSGGVIDISEDRLIKLVACRLVQSRVPFRGKELKLLRQATGLSLNRFAQKLGITYGAVFAWEKGSRTRLLLVNEIAVRLLCASEFGIELPGRFTELIGEENHQPVEVKVTNKKPTKQRMSKVKMMMKPSYRGHRLVAVKDKDNKG